jgi:hypothetical protein
MTWLFDRGIESLTLEVRQGEAGYELLVHHPNGTHTLQSVATATELLEQVQSMPSALLTDGWHHRVGATG